jgi:hypothetical protein
MRLDSHYRRLAKANGFFKTFYVSISNRYVWRQKKDKKMSSCHTATQYDTTTLKINRKWNTTLVEERRHVCNATLILFIFYINFQFIHQTCIEKMQNKHLLVNVEK